jgi:hypothetical protein
VNGRAVSAIDLYVCTAVLDRARIVFLWASGGEQPDRVVLDDDGFMVTFPSEYAARAASVNGAAVSSERVTRYKLDALVAWCMSGDDVRDCSVLLNAWNLFGDLPRSDSFREADARGSAIYDKLFWGCNLPAMTPPGEHYVPVWSTSELADLKHLLLLGVAEFRARVKRAG